MGVSLNEFWQLTPHSLYLITDGYKLRLKQQMEYDNTIAHLQGAYFVEALLATVGNMFSGKSSKRMEYPEKPHDLNLDKFGKSHNHAKQNIGINDSYNEKQLKLFAAQLTTAMHNFNVSKKAKENMGKEE